MKQPSGRLVQAIIAKSILETILVGALALIFFVTAFPPNFHGWGEATPDAIAGWVVNSSSPWQRVEIQLFIDGRFVAAGVANLPRPDVVQARWSRDEWHGYTFPLKSFASGVHEARIYALHDSGLESRMTLQMVGNPIRFAIDNNGVMRDLDHPRK